MKWPTLRIFKKILLRIAPRILAHAIAAQTHCVTKAMARAKFQRTNLVDLTRGFYL